MGRKEQIIKFFFKYLEIIVLFFLNIALVSISGSDNGVNIKVDKSKVIKIDSANLNKDSSFTSYKYHFEVIVENRREKNINNEAIVFQFPGSINIIDCNFHDENLHYIDSSKVKILKNDRIVYSFKVLCPNVPRRIDVYCLKMLDYPDSTIASCNFPYSINGKKKDSSPKTKIVSFIKKYGFKISIPTSIIIIVFVRLLRRQRKREFYQRWTKSIDENEDLI